MIVEEYVMKNIILSVFITAMAVLLLPFAATYAADDVESGQRDASFDAVQSNGQWEGDFRISWEIKQEGSLYHYVYKITDNAGNPVKPNIKHLLLEVSPDINTRNLANEIDVRSDGGVTSIGRYSTNRDNPGLPDDIYALQFDVLKNDSGEYVVEFYSNRPPVWGDFYAQGAARDYAYNVGFGADSPGDGADVALAGEKPMTLWIPTPSTGAASIATPEPGTWLILGSTLAAVAYSRRKKQTIPQK